MLTADIHARTRAEVLSLAPGAELDHYVCQVFLGWHEGHGPDARWWLDAAGQRTRRRLANTMMPHRPEPAFSPSRIEADADFVWLELARRDVRVSIRPGFAGKGWQAIWRGREHDLCAQSRPLLVCWCALLAEMGEGG